MLSFKRAAVFSMWGPEQTKTTGMLLNLLFVISVRFIKIKVGKNHCTEEPVSFYMNLKRKEINHEPSWQCSLRSLSHVISHSLPSSSLLRLSLWYTSAKNITWKHLQNGTRRRDVLFSPLHPPSHDNCDTTCTCCRRAERKDRSPLTFASAVGCCCHSNTIMLTP